MRVHGDNKLRRRIWSGELRDYRDARKELAEDFNDICGYCGKSSKYFKEHYHIDHFVPRRIAEEMKNQYSNLVWSCPKCNLSKSGKWPTENKNLPYDNEKGFIDPVSEEFDQHLERKEDGCIVGKSVLGCNMCENLNFHIRRTGLIWKIQQMMEIQDKMDELYKQRRLDEKYFDFYIMSNLMIKDYFSKIAGKGD